jgi:mannose-1-phosphate guanylyltransferase/mannose-6-phosphate isomerase
MTIIPVILAGGSGTRLWPLSRKYLPKQFLPLVGKNSMLQETLLRLKGLENLGDPVIVCNKDYRFIVSEQLTDINIVNSTILLEPSGRNSAPAIAAAAFSIIKDKTKNAVMLVLSADHEIQNIRNFHLAINSATKQANKENLVTFGIRPDEPNTEYGYISCKSEIDENCYKVSSFIEKPELGIAKKFLRSGNYLWNSGMFMFKPQVLIDEMEVYCSEILSYSKKSVYASTKDFSFIRLDKDSFDLCPSNSIDYALMEKSQRVVVVLFGGPWSDVGSWSSLYELGTKDSKGNVIKGDVYTENTSNCYIYSNNQLTTAIGVEDLIIVNTPDATLISTKAESSKVKRIVKRLKENKRTEQDYNAKVHRPWGWYETIESGQHFQVKRLHVNSGAKLSLQKHYKRSEHWVVVSGIATAINGDSKLTLSEGQSTFIPVNTKHTLENLESFPLEIIEVQSGTYLGEDDIVRFEDNYGRS